MWSEFMRKGPGYSYGPVIKNALYPLCTTLGILLLWQAAVVLLSVPEFILPGPFIIVKSFFARFDLIFKHTLVTLAETLIGLFIAIGFSIVVSILLVCSRPLEKTLMPLMVFFQTTPKVAIAPLFIVCCG
jgi:NitT/TauT family transport system permease protein